MRRCSGNKGLSQFHGGISGPRLSQISQSDRLEHYSLSPTLPNSNPGGLQPWVRPFLEKDAVVSHQRPTLLALGRMHAWVLKGRSGQHTTVATTAMEVGVAMHVRDICSFWPREEPQPEKQGKTMQQTRSSLAHQNTILMLRTQSRFHKVFLSLCIYVP